MIRFADSNTAPLVRSMWKTCFGDSDAFMDLYFGRKYKNENTLIYFEDDVAIASLQILPYKIRFYGKEISCSYISGACTLPEYRGKGYMTELLAEAFNVMQERHIPISILIPAEDWLFRFYEKCGYTQTFDAGVRPLEFKSLLYEFPFELDKAYSVFDNEYQQSDFCVLKTKEDFEIIIEEYILDGCPSKYNLAGMARIIDVWGVLSLYAGKNPRQKFRIKITDRFLNSESVYLVQDAGVDLIFSEDWDFEVDIQMLTRLLFGYHIDDLSKELKEYFKKHTPVMNLMLE